MHKSDTGSISSLTHKHFFNPVVVNGLVQLFENFEVSLEYLKHVNLVFQLLVL